MAPPFALNPNNRKSLIHHTETSPEDRSGRHQAHDIKRARGRLLRQLLESEPRIRDHTLHIFARYFVGLENLQTGIKAVPVASGPVGIDGELVQQAGFVNPRLNKQRIKWHWNLQPAFGKLISLFVASLVAEKPARPVERLGPCRQRIRGAKVSVDDLLIS